MSLLRALKQLYYLNDQLPENSNLRQSNMEYIMQVSEREGLNVFRCKLFLPLNTLIVI